MTIDECVTDMYNDVVITGRYWIEPVRAASTATWRIGTRGLQVETFGNARVWRKIDGATRYAVSEPRSDIGQAPALVALWDWMTGD